ncbi:MULTISPECIES: chromosome partitioning protein ParB [unclassified Nostoc]|uniref:ParB N-terminal domain-containing protein n=1 Tax=unclassified Nostoc TaxID=2593658 RepID=UPI0025AB4C04|nr:MULTISPECIES: chromosome partitioning protein ParB [unclassified Nostoc]MDM9583683.1 chromosome partitioning protein ParB [Nostoc sp. GT001]MDZ7945723.1 chromosome partitioning protein ParB [Nostoc sp. EfeVER01]MDZ7994230.1 chromosome partitioning protein ParB [Nostoc sp. EspVER01]
MINFSLVDVKSIASNEPRSNFAESDLENLADIIIETGGIIRPLVVKVTGVESYTVVDGHFEYYAAVRAREKNPRQGEMVNAFVIAPKLEDLVVKQVASLKGIDFSTKQVTPQPETTKLEPRLANLELRLEKQFNEFKSEFLQERQRIDSQFKQLENLIPQKGEQSNPLTLLNTLDKDELSIKLQRSRISGAEKLAKAIEDARHKKPKQEFEDYRDVVKSVKNLGDKTILTIIDEWSRN